MIAIPATAVPTAGMVDVQAQADHRRVAIDRVGVSNIRYPMSVVDRGGVGQRTVATVNLFVELPHQFRGTHMSRFLEVLNRYDEVSARSVEEITRELQCRLHAETAHLEMEFPYFVRRAAPVTGAAGQMEFGCGLRAETRVATDLVMSVRVPVTTLCPCSKEISDRGAHNQRGVVELEVRAHPALWFEELIETIEAGASCALYPVLKRADEKWVTERAYDNPRFVEDLIREVAVAMREDPRVTWYRIQVENQESIHAHNAFAALERWK